MLNSCHVTLSKFTLSKGSEHNFFYFGRVLGFLFLELDKNVGFITIFPSPCIVAFTALYHVYIGESLLLITILRFHWMYGTLALKFNRIHDCYLY